MRPDLVTGTFELHLFVLPLDPPADVVRAFTEACAGPSAQPPMKGLLLQLDYQHRGFVGCLQSSRYVRGDVTTARREADHDARVLEQAGFEVVRRKVEAVATNAGVPASNAEAANASPDRYFEFHLLFDGVAGPISNDQVASLRSIAAEASASLGVPVPLSYNALKPGQRFLNLRARGCGLAEARETVEDLGARVDATGSLKMVKVISEYVCFDDNLAIDHGWLEPLP